MMPPPLLLLLLPLLLVCLVDASEVAETRHHRTKAVILSPLPQNYVEDAALPARFSWCEKIGEIGCTPILNQREIVSFSPNNNRTAAATKPNKQTRCRSSWAHAAVSSVADRFAPAVHGASFLVSKNASHWIPSVQVLLNCAHEIGGTCMGGTDPGAYQYMYEKGLPPDRCQPYSGADGNCASPASICMTVKADGTRVPNSNFEQLFISEYGSVRGEENIQKEVFARGPVSCGIDVSVLTEYTGGVIQEEHDSPSHFISIVGWGVDKNIPYWLCRQSWGTQWGELGWFRVARDIYYQPECHWAVPKSASLQP